MMQDSVSVIGSAGEVFIFRLFLPPLIREPPIGHEQVLGVVKPLGISLDEGIVRYSSQVNGI